MKKALLLLFVLIVVACGSDSPTSPSKPAYETIYGEWEIVMNGRTYINEMTAEENYCFFIGDKFDGTWSDKTFTGLIITSDKYSTYNITLTLTIIDENKIMGNRHTEIFNSSGSYFNNSKFIGQRKIISNIF